MDGVWLVDSSQPSEPDEVKIPLKQMSGTIFTNPLDVPSDNLEGLFGLYEVQSFMIEQFEKR